MCYPNASSSSAADVAVHDSSVCRCSRPCSAAAACRNPEPGEVRVQKRERGMLSRRELIGKAAVGAAAALAVGGAAGTAIAATKPARTAADDPTGGRNGPLPATDD